MFVMNMSWPNRIGYCLYVCIIVTTGSYGGRIDKKADTKRSKNGHFCVQRKKPRLYSNNNVFYEALAWELKDVWHPSWVQNWNWAWSRRRRFWGILAEVERVLKEELQDFKNVREPRHPNSLVKSLRMGSHGHMVATWGFFGASKSK